MKFVVIVFCLSSIVHAGMKNSRISNFEIEKSKQLMKNYNIFGEYSTLPLESKSSKPVQFIATNSPQVNFIDIGEDVNLSCETDGYYEVTIDLRGQFFLLQNFPFSKGNK